MSFTFNWPRFSDQFHYDAIQMLNTALNKGNKPPVIADKIEVVELEMGTQPPELEIRDIGDLTVDHFRGIFRLTYSGDAHLVLKTKVQANPLNHKQSEIHLMAGSRGMLAAKQPLAVPMLLRLSHFKLNSYVVLVVSKQKGITLVFKTDPLQHVDINSTFDSIAVIQNFIQREIETQLRQMFREDLPGIIHRLSQQWIKAKVEAPYLSKRPLAPPAQRARPPLPPHRPSETKSADPFYSSPHDIHSVASAPVRRRPSSVSGASVASTSRGRFVSSKVTPSVIPPPSHQPDSSNSFDPEPYDFTYGLRPEGLPAKSLFKGFSSLFTPNKGLADLTEEPSENEDIDEEEEEDDASTSYDVVDWDGDGTADPLSPIFGTASEKEQQSVTEYETIPAVGGGIITRPRVVHSSSQIQSSFDGTAAGLSGGRGTPGVLTRSQSYNNITPPRSGFATPGQFRSLTPDLLEARVRASRMHNGGYSGLRSGFTMSGDGTVLSNPLHHGAGHDSEDDGDDFAHPRARVPIRRGPLSERRMSACSATTFDSTDTVYPDDPGAFHTGLSPPTSYYQPHRHDHHRPHKPHHLHSAFDQEYDNDDDDSYELDNEYTLYHHRNSSNPNLSPPTPTSSSFIHPSTNAMGTMHTSTSPNSMPNFTPADPSRIVSGGYNPKIVLRPTLLNTTIHQLSSLSHENHTLSPYTRSMNHFTARSVPPKTSTSSGPASRSGSGSGAPGDEEKEGSTGPRSSLGVPGSATGLGSAAGTTTSAGIIGRSTKLGGGRVAGSAAVSMFVAEREKQNTKARRRRIYRIGGGDNAAGAAPESQSGLGHDAAAELAHMAPMDAYGRQYLAPPHHNHPNSHLHPPRPQPQPHQQQRDSQFRLGKGFPPSQPSTPSKRGKFKGAPIAPGGSGVGPGMLSPRRTPSEFDVEDMDRYFRSNEDLSSAGGSGNVAAGAR